MQETFITKSTKIDLKDVDLTGKTQKQLAELARSALGESMHLARRSVESAWCAGRFLTCARKNAKHGTWRKWLDDQGIDKNMAARVMQIFSEYEMSQLGTFETVTAALRAIPRQHHIEEKTSDPEVKITIQEGNNVYDVDRETVEVTPREAVDITTGEIKEWNPTDRKPTAEQQLRAHEDGGAWGGIYFSGTETQDLTARDLKKNSGVPIEPRKPQAKTMPRNMRYNAEKNCIEVMESLGLTDYVVISARDFWRVVNGYPVQSVGRDQIIYQKGEVIR